MNKRDIVKYSSCILELISPDIYPYDNSGGDRLGYKIQYSTDKMSKKAIPPLSQFQGLFVCVLLGVSVMALLALTICYRGDILDWILPGDAQTTVSAFKELIANLHDGDSAGTAIKTFCTSILENAT